MTALDLLTRFETRWSVPTLDVENVTDAALLAQANAWVAHSADLIDAYLTLYRLHDAAFAVQNPGNRADLLHMYANAMSEVRDALETRRDDALALVQPTFDPAADEAVTEANDALSDWLSDNTTTVQAALNAARMNRCTTLENRRDA